MASPVSDDSSSSERRPLREFIDQPRVQERLAAMSPRSALLSQSSLRTHTPDEQSMDLNGAVDSGGQLRKYDSDSRRKRGHDVATRRPSALTQLLEIDSSRKDPKDEVMRLREILKTIEHQSSAEATRARELELSNREAQQRVQDLTANRLAAEQQVIKAQQEVRLVQLQLENAQKEIERSQDAMKAVEQQRDEAEAEAARARAKARKLHQEKIAAIAREEGRRLGFQAGFDYARVERQMITAKRRALPSSRSSTPHETKTNSRNDKGKQRAYTDAKREEDMPDDISIPRRTRSRQPSPQPLPPARVETVDDIIVSPPSEQMSPSQLPLKGLPIAEYRSENFSMPPPAESTPLHPFVPPPESESGFPQNYAPEIRPPPDEYYARSKTPSVQIYNVDIPPASELNQQYNNSMENETIPPQPQDQWVTARTYQQIRGPPRPRGKQPPPPLLPPPRPLQPLQTAPNGGPAAPPSKTVKFPLIPRPSLAKTKEQATSWYRSFSLRKKKKRVIDPIPEEALSPGPLTASTSRIDESQPHSATEPPYTGESQESYGQAMSGQPPESWYQKEPSMYRGPSVPPSVRSGYSRRRAASDAMSVSTRVSQYDLLATPAAPAAMSVRSGKEGPKRVREKESYLSVINEDPSSRGNTPERYIPRPSTENLQPMSFSISQPNFAQRPLHQQSSVGTFNSSNQRAGRRVPPGITVPDPDQELEPFGVAYNRALGLQPGHQYPTTDLTRRPSRISEKATPDTSRSGQASIMIDVVPPSGVAPPVVNSPPHTGKNHLSPYHTYQPAAPAFSQSVASLRSQGANNHADYSERPPSAAASRKQSKQSINAYADTAPHYASSSSNQQRPVSTSYSRPPSGMKNNNYDYSGPSQNYEGARSSQYQGQYQQQSRPESVRSATPKRPISRAQQQYPSTSQVSLSLTADGGVRGQPINAGSTRLVLATPIQRKGSNASLRSQGSYSKYDPTGYVDPAFWPPDGPPEPPPTDDRHVDGYFDKDAAPPRPTSAYSGLSYV